MVDTPTRSEPASVSQRVLQLMERYRGRHGGLNNPVLYQLAGRCDVAAFERAVAALAARHEALRTTFAGWGQRLSQQVHDQLPADITVVDVAGRANPVAAAREALGTALSTSLDLTVTPIRWLVLQRRDDHLVCANVHHLATDGWSNDLIARDMRVLYHRETGAGTDELPPVDWQYADFARWQRERLDGPAGARHRQFWQQQLADARSPVIPRRTVVPAERTGRAQAVHFGISPGLTGRLQQLATEQRTTLFTVMLSVFSAYLYAESGQTDVAVATLLANRKQRELGNTVGCFSTLAVLRTRLGDEPTFLDVVRGTRSTVLSALTHQEYPLQLLPPNVIGTDTGRADDVVFQMLPTVTRDDSLGDTVDGLFSEDRRGARFDLEIILAAQGDGLAGSVRYAVDKFDPDWAPTFAETYARCAEDAVNAPDKPIERRSG
ncbi:MAG: condensation domain-containing protein [Actinocatenispora sp.]